MSVLRERTWPIACRPWTRGLRGWPARAAALDEASRWRWAARAGRCGSASVAEVRPDRPRTFPVAWTARR